MHISFPDNLPTFIFIPTPLSVINYLLLAFLVCGKALEDSYLQMYLW